MARDSRARSFNPASPAAASQRDAFALVRRNQRTCVLCVARAEHIWSRHPGQQVLKTRAGHAKARGGFAAQSSC